MIAPSDCTTMAEVRAGVDDLDRQISALIGTRFAFMDAAARIKPERAEVRDTARKDDVLVNAHMNAVANGWPTEAAVKLWDGLVEASIAYEFDAFDALRSPSGAD